MPLSQNDVSDGVLLNLQRETFDARGEWFLRSPSFRVEGHRNDHGVEMLCISNSVGHVVVLPFTGQQVWDAHFYGRRLTMESVFETPVRTMDYMANNGAYLIHCGGSAMGNPSPEDSHPLHGELPNMDMTCASIQWRAEVDGGTETLTVFSEGVHRRAFGSWFSIELQLTLSAGSGLMESRVKLTNLSKVPQPMMYLAHLNFLPAIGGSVEEELCSGQEITTRGGALAHASAPSHFLEEGLEVSPEVVQVVPLRPCNTTGWRTSAQVHTDGSRDVVQHRDPLTHTIRWMRRAGDDAAFAFAMPATAEPDGYSQECRKGNVVMYPSGEGITARFRHGALPAKPS